MKAIVFFILLLSRPLTAAESVPFDICAESASWTRPSPQMQQTKIWNNPRYKDGRDAYAWKHNFVVISDFQSLNLAVTLTNLAGLWTVKPLWVQKCYIDQDQRRSRVEWMEVWSLLHRVKEIQNDGNTKRLSTYRCCYPLWPKLVDYVTANFEWSSDGDFKYPIVSELLRKCEKAHRPCDRKHSSSTH